jgi:predicted enzyme related to lactoylglutathione lyase
LRAGEGKTGKDVIERVPASGGGILKARYPAGDLRIATIRDPAGNVIGLWQQATR